METTMNSTPLAEKPTIPGHSLAFKTGVGSTLAFIALLAISGNMLVIIAVFTDYRLKKHSNYLLVSLAVADLLVAVLVMPFAIVNDLEGQWYFGAIYCRLWISFDIMCSTASILHLCVISYDRYKHITDPLHYNAWMTTERSVLMIGGVWAISAFISFLPIHLDWHSHGKSFDADMCILNLSQVYAVVSSCISFYVPAVILLVNYVVVYRLAKSHARTIRRTSPVCKSSLPKRLSNRASETLISRRIVRSLSTKVTDNKATFTLGVIIGIFLACWLPFFIVNVMSPTCGEECGITPQLFQFVMWLGYFNSCLNPIIYSIFNMEFRHAFKRILSRKCTTHVRRRISASASISSKTPVGTTDTVVSATCILPAAGIGTITATGTSVTGTTVTGTTVTTTSTVTGTSVTGTGLAINCKRGVPASYHV